MRISRLCLLRYGRFTDKVLEFPEATQDIHLIYGPNEAGKSTTLTAIEDLLFGFPNQSPYSFLHPYESMRIGTVLNDDEHKLEFQRRRSRSGTIVGADGLEISGGDRDLARCLGGADREFFVRMFNLSHSRLAEGGRTILDAKDDVGQMLFAAGTGLADLKKKLKRIEADANDLWSPRKSKNRSYYQAQERFENAESKHQQIKLSADKWKKTERAFIDANTRREKRKEEHADKSTELRKASRIRRVYGHLQRRRELTDEIASLADVSLLPEDAAKLLNEAKRSDSEIKSVLRNIEADLKSNQDKLEAISYDEQLIIRTGDIRKLDELYITARNGRADLPKRKSELQFELNSMARLATDIGWAYDEPTSIANRIPSKSKIDVIRHLISQHGELAEKERNAKEALEESELQLNSRTELLMEIGEEVDTSSLLAAVNATRGTSDAAANIRAAEFQLNAISKEIENKLHSLKPALNNHKDIDSLVLPTTDTVISYRDKFGDLYKEQSETNRNLNELSNELAQVRTTLAHRIDNEGALEPDALKASRHERDALWDLIVAHYIERSDASAELLRNYVKNVEDLPAAYTEAVNKVDTITDQRFDQAQTAAELLVLSRNIASLEVRVEQSNSTKNELKSEAERLTNSWQALWSEVPLEGSLGVPDLMLKWLETLTSVATLRHREQDHHLSIDASSAEEQEAITLMRSALREAGEDNDTADINNLRILIERADEYLHKQEARTEKIKDMREGVRELTLEVERRQRNLVNAKTELALWNEEWRKAIASVDMDSDDTLDTVTAKVKVIEEMRDHASEATNLQEKRINTIQRDIDVFEKTASGLIQDLTPELAGTEFDTSTIELKRLHEQALKLHQQHENLTEAIQERQAEIEELVESQQSAWSKVQPLMDSIGTSDVSKLTAAVDLSDKLRTLQAELTKVSNELRDHGDGFPTDVLEDECRNVDPDTIHAREEQLEAELAGVTKQLESDIATLTETQKELESMGSGDGAAQAAVDKEEALASMNNAAEHYVRLWTSAALLRWAIDCYRREKQGPLLKRAGELFRVLTSRSFKSLEVNFDEKDKMQLFGVRPEGETVGVPGLSSGTEDQLFLSLRIAAIEDYLTRAQSLPFVADDLFINFDEERAAAGFEVLRQLSEKTQILFFTHHAHLVTIAKENLANDVNVVSL